MPSLRAGAAADLHSGQQREAQHGLFDMSAVTLHVPSGIASGFAVCGVPSLHEQLAEAAADLYTAGFHFGLVTASDALCARV